MTSPNLIHRARFAALLAAFCAAPLGAQETGRIVGTVLDAGTAAPLASVQVFTEDQTVGAISSIDGRYVLRGVPAGAVTIVAQSLGYSTKTITGVQVAANGVAQLDISLEQQAVALEGITVTAEVETGSTAGLIAERQRSAIVTDAIGAEQIEMSPDGDAAAALQRVPGLSVVGGKYAYVRGLGERYSATTLNGAPLASPVPDKKVIPLDVIPSDLLESVVTAKSYSPDKPGDYAGGLVELKTKNFPRSQILKFSLSTGINTVSAFESGLFYNGGGRDWLGFDDGTRDLPSTIPLDRPVIFGEFTRDELETIGQGFTGDWGPQVKESLPANLGVGFSYGNEFDVGNGLGLLVSGTYDNKTLRLDGMVERVLAGSEGGGIAEQPEVDYQGESTINSVALGALVNLSYELFSTSRLSLNTVFNHLMDDASRVLQGFNLDSGTDQRNFRLQYLEQTMLNSQLKGEHLLTGLGDTKVDWRVGLSDSRRYEPNTREVLYRQDNGIFLFDTFIQSGSVFHQDQKDRGYNGGLDVKVPFTMAGDLGTLSLGGSFDSKDRETFSRRFRYLPLPGGIIDSDVRALDPNDLIVPEHIRPDGFEIREATFRADNYDAEERIYAGYAMFDGSLSSRLRLMTGLRVESATQWVQARDLFQNGGEQVPLDPADLDNTDLLPALNVTFAAGDETNLRLGASRTVGRPQLRELAPFAFADFAGGYLVTGNPRLERSRIQNYDVRWEWFFTPRGVLAASAFYKRFDQPIEVIVLPSSELLKTWVNADDAYNYGVELEFRTPLEPLSESLRNFDFNANLTLVESEVNTGATAAYYVVGSGPTDIAVVDKNRPLQGQSPWVFNVGLTFFAAEGRFSATGLVNGFGRRIDAVGGQATPDIYEEERVTTDIVLEYGFTSGLKAKLAGSRLTGNVIEFTQGGEILRQWDAGRNISLSFSWAVGG